MRSISPWMAASSAASHLSSTTSVLISASVSFGIFRVSLGVELGLGVLQPLLEVGLFVVELQPFVEHGGFVLRLLVALDLLQAGGDVGLVHLVEFGERAVLAAVLLLQLGESGR